MTTLVAVQQILAAMRAVTGPGPVALHEPYFSGKEWVYVKECLDSTFVSSVGPFVDQLEADLANYTGARYAVVVVNGTAALHIALLLAGVRPGDEVLVPALTFAATANSIVYCGAVPHFVDSEFRTLGLDPLKLRDYLSHIGEQRNGQCINRATGHVIRAVVPMHTFGHPVDMDGVISVARDFNIAIVEDAAESIGSFYYGRHTGTLGSMGTLSFNGNKTITTGGGGAILTNNRALAQRAKHLTTTAKTPHTWEYRHDEIGYNYRMPNINAALGCAQLEQLPELLQAKRTLFALYEAEFRKISGVKVVREPEGCRSNYWLQSLVLERCDAAYRDEILSATNEAGLMTRPVWTLMHHMPHFKSCPRMPLSVAEALEARLINIPSSAQLVSARGA